MGRLFAFGVVVVLLLLSAVSLVATQFNFVPDPGLSSPAMVLVSGVPGLILAVIGIAGSRRQPDGGLRGGRMVVALVMLPVAMGLFVFWGLSHGLPWIYTLAVGRPVTHDVVMTTHQVGSRRARCEFAARGTIGGGRVKLCIAPALYRARPGQAVRFRVRGLGSPLGFAVTSYHELPLDDP